MGSTFSSNSAPVQPFPQLQSTPKPEVDNYVQHRYDNLVRNATAIAAQDKPEIREALDQIKALSIKVRDRSTDPETSVETQCTRLNYIIGYLEQVKDHIPPYTDWSYHHDINMIKKHLKCDRY